MQQRMTLLTTFIFFFIPIMLSAQAPDIDVQGGNPYRSIPDGDSTPSKDDGTDYGFSDVPLQIKTHCFRIRNTGDAMLIIEGLDDSGPNASDFYYPYMRLPVGFGISPGSNLEFDYAFDPSDYGVRTTILNITTNDPDEGTYSFTLQGTGGIPDIEVTGGNPPQSIEDGDTTPSPADDTDFGTVDVADGWSMRYLQIRNTGNANLYISGLTRDGPHKADFIKVNRYVVPIIVPPGDDHYILDIKFDPSDIGIRSATYSILSDDPDEATFDFAIRGIGGITEMNVKGNGNSIPDGGGHSTHNGTAFGSVFIGDTETHTFTIENTGSGDLQLTGPTKVSIGGTHASDFMVSEQPDDRVAPGSTTTFSVQFQPSGPGQRIASLSILNNDADENPYDIGLDGWGCIEVTFTNGGNTPLNFVQSTPSLPADNWPMGQFSVSVGTDAVLAHVVVSLGGTYSGLSGAKPFRIYGSNTNNFSTASAEGFDAAASGGSVTVEVNDAISTDTRYYWLTVDLMTDAEGTISGTIGDASKISVLNGSPGLACKYGSLNTDQDIILLVDTQSQSLPEDTYIEKPYPNPFNIGTSVSYHLSEATHVNITVFDMLGRLIKTLYDDEKSAGSYEAYWNGTQEDGETAPSGIFFISMQTNKMNQIQKVLLVK